MFYELAKRVLRNNRCIAMKLRSDMSSEELMMRLDAKNLTFEECCRFVVVAEDAELLRYVMERFGMTTAKVRLPNEAKARVH